MKLLSARKKNTHILDLVNLWLVVVGLAVALPVLSGCQHGSNTSASTPEVGESRSAAALRQSTAVSQSASLDDYAVARQGLQLLMPGDGNWSYFAGVGAWSALKRSSSGEELWLYHQPARRTISVAECESVARSTLALLRHGLGAAHQRPFQAPAGYGGKLNVVLLEDGGGVVEAFSVAASRCLAAAYRIEAGPGFGERMRIIVHETLPSLTVLSADSAFKRQAL